jgi:hypothetical protein
VKLRRILDSSDVARSPAVEVSVLEAGFRCFRVSEAKAIRDANMGRLVIGVDGGSKAG